MEGTCEQVAGWEDVWARANEEQKQEREYECRKPKQELQQDSGAATPNHTSRTSGRTLENLPTSAFKTA